RSRLHPRLLRRDRDGRVARPMRAPRSALHDRQSELLLHGLGGGPIRLRRGPRRDARRVRGDAPGADLQAARASPRSPSLRSAAAAAGLAPAAVRARSGPRLELYAQRRPSSTLGLRGAQSAPYAPSPSSSRTSRNAWTVRAMSSSV